MFLHLLWFLKWIFISNFCFNLFVTTIVLYRVIAVSSDTTVEVRESIRDIVFYICIYWSLLCMA